MRREVVVLMMIAGAWTPATSARALSLWDGVYTEAQAGRGETIYRQRCASCHGPTLDGTETAPELRGSTLLAPYYGKSVQDLFANVREKMPKDAPGTLTPQQAADVIAYVFRVNKAPAGASELPAAPAALSVIRIEPRPR
ncbi:MAG: cytochrome c [Acidobacteria bacterium]|nr:cytochrome c [Acidobacteriota bacterium]